jgi:hypothetical protein
VSHLSTLVLHRMRAGELGPQEIVAAKDHLASCARCRSRLDAQEAARSAFEAARLPPAIAALETPANRPWMAVVGPVIAVAAAILCVVLVGTPHGRVEPDVRFRGALPDVELWVATADGPRAVRADDALHAGQTVQVLYATHDAAYAVLAGRDGSGRVEVYGELPTHDALAPAPFALTLDGAAGPQQFYVITADRPIASDEVGEAVYGLVPDVAVRSVSVAKE